jgi:hypothetical protein
MSGFDSSIGSKRFSQQGQMREFVVPDGDEVDHFEVSSEEELWRQRKLKAEGKERMSSGAKKRIEYLCNMSMSVKDIVINDIPFKIKTLKTKEVREAFVEIAKYDGTIEGTFEIRRQFLARALVAVDNQDIGLFLGDDSLQTRLQFIDELDDAVVDKLHKEYAIFSEEHSNKYNPKNTEETKGLVEDLKK